MAFLHEYRFCRLDFFIQLLQAVRRRFIFFFRLCRLFRFAIDPALIFCIGFDLRIGDIRRTRLHNALLRLCKQCRPPRGIADRLLHGARRRG